MATTRLISMHKNKGKSIAKCLADRIDYALNPDKTNDGEYVVPMNVTQNSKRRIPFI